MDTTYWGRSYGIMVFRSYELKKNILRKEAKWETIQDYKDEIKLLQNQGRIIKVIVCDGKKMVAMMIKYPCVDVYLPSKKSGENQTGNLWSGNLTYQFLQLRSKQPYDPSFWERFNDPNKDEDGMI